MYNDGDAEITKNQRESQEKFSKKSDVVTRLLVQATLLALAPADRLPQTARAGSGCALGPVAQSSHLRHRLRARWRNHVVALCASVFVQLVLEQLVLEWAWHGRQGGVGL